MVKISTRQLIIKKLYEIELLIEMDGAELFDSFDLDSWVVCAYYFEIAKQLRQKLREGANELRPRD